MFQEPLSVTITFKNGQVAEYQLTNEAIERLTNAFSSYWATSNPRGLWIDVQRADGQHTRLFLQFDEIMYIG